MHLDSFKPRTVIAGSLAIAFMAGYGISGTQLITSALAITPSTAPATAPGRPSGFPDFSTIVARNGAAVVNISISGTQKAAMVTPSMPQTDPDDPAYQFFRHFQLPMPQSGSPVHGTGSGFIINPDGVILTNAHVVADATDVTVKLTDGREFKARVLGMDKQSDVAVLKIDARNLPSVKIGDSTQTRVGDWVLAIGSPFGFENSATAGIVSAKSRSLPDEGYVSFIQTDAAVNPGNSGGPLFNLDGEVVGINSQIYSRSGGYQGLSFAIPIDVAMKVEQPLEKQGHVEHGHFGVTIQGVDQSLADSFGMKKPAGALVSAVESGSAAAKAGIVPGDVILEFNGKPVTHYNDLPPLVADLKPGTEAKVMVWHNGATQALKVVVGGLKDDAVAASAGHPDQGRLGLLVRPLTPGERKQAEVSGGLVVEESSGPASMAGIESGDIILALNGTPVTSTDQLHSLVAKSARHVALLVQRGNDKLFVPIDLVS
ncbi:putative periplasmic serine endoprotease DegP-like precursor [mine drainage metagenome]|uniref:Probable periplasmic serine endoprotease DegP-like n=1 Tax=mine drainage metagenome TaxID=410659 RepID=A0A1J5R427_9ZZZZ